MTDRKAETFTSTGAHRAWVGEGAAAVRPAGATDAARNWLPRSQTSNSRHGAITKSLRSFPSYKSWTERIKSNWDKEQKQNRDQEQ